MVSMLKYRDTTRYYTGNDYRVRLDGSFLRLFLDTGANLIIHPFNFLYSYFNYLFPNIISSFSLYKICLYADLQRKYWVSSIKIMASQGIK